MLVRQRKPSHLFVSKPTDILQIYYLVWTCLIPFQLSALCYRPTCGLSTQRNISLFLKQLTRVERSSQTKIVYIFLKAVVSRLGSKQIVQAEQKEGPLTLTKISSSEYESEAKSNTELVLLNQSLLTPPPSSLLSQSLLPSSLLSQSLPPSSCYELKPLELNNRITLVLSNIRELNRDLFTN